MGSRYKYRAWDGKKMHYFNGIFNQRPYIETSTFPQYESCPEYLELEIMQYTGLKDSDEKEIYEGDILDEKWKWEVIYFADGFIGKHETPANSMPLLNILRKRDADGCLVEIIGNIYENPELVKT